MSIMIGVEEPDDSDSLPALRLPRADVMVLFEMLNTWLVPLNLRSAENALFIVPTEESVATD